jgi:two-component system chemotaxis sensor kinase CheA
MTEAEAMGLIFRAGFSTRSKQVTEISGRGIGLDSVVQAIQSLKGTGIAVRRRQPEGTVFEFRIKRA